jgi:hypothetical protein
VGVDITGTVGAGTAGAADRKLKSPNISVDPAEEFDLFEFAVAVPLIVSDVCLFSPLSAPFTDLNEEPLCCDGKEERVDSAVGAVVFGTDGGGGGGGKLDIGDSVLDDGGAGGGGDSLNAPIVCAVAGGDNEAALAGVVADGVGYEGVIVGVEMDPICAVFAAGVLTDVEGKV